MSLANLQEQRGRLVTQAREALEEIRSNTDDARATELETRHDTIMADLDRLDANIAREERVARAERQQDEAREARALAGRPPYQATEADASGSGEITYRDAFHAYLRSNLQGADPLTAEERSVLRAGYTTLPAEQRAQITTTNTAGGYTVPTDMLALLVRSMLMYGPMYDGGVAFEWMTENGHLTQIPTVNDTGNTGVAFTQGVTLTDTGSADVVFGQKTIGAWAFNTPWIRVSREMASDSILAVESLLASLLGERLGRMANAKLTTGAGTTEPLGIVTGASAGVTAASSTAIAADELFDMAHIIDPAYRGSDKFQWMFNDQTLKFIRKLKDGQGRYLWQMGDVRVNAPSMLLDHPYRVNQAMAGIATGNKSVLIGDFNKFMVRKVGAPLVGAISDKDFWPGYGMAGYIRFDSQVLDSAAIKVLAHP